MDQPLKIDRAIGTTFESNAFNMILFVALDAMHAEQLSQAKQRVPFFEPDALLMIFVLVGALTIVYRLS